MTELTEEQKRIRADIIDCFIIYDSDVVPKRKVGRIVFPHGLEAINDTIEKMQDRGEIEGAEMDDTKEEAIKWTGDEDRIKT